MHSHELRWMPVTQPSSQRDSLAVAQEHLFYFQAECIGEMARFSVANHGFMYSRTGPSWPELSVRATVRCRMSGACWACTSCTVPNT